MEIPEVKKHEISQDTLDKLLSLLHIFGDEIVTYIQDAKKSLERKFTMSFGGLTESHEIAQASSRKGSSQGLSNQSLKEEIWEGFARNLVVRLTIKPVEAAKLSKYLFYQIQSLTKHKIIIDVEDVEKYDDELLVHIK